MSVRRRQVLAVATASLALAVVGCSPMAMARKRRKRKVQQYLSGLDAVASARVEVHPEFVEPDRWIVDVRLKDDPSAESVATVVRDAYAEVLRLTGDGEARMVVTWVKGKTSVFCYLPMKDVDKAASATVEAVSPGMERVQIEEERVSFGYRTAETLPDHFILPPTSPVLRLGSLRVEQSILVGRSHCFISHAKGKDLTSVPIKRALESIPSDKRYGAVLSLEAEDKGSHQVRLVFKKWAKDWQGVEVGAAAPVLAAALGNRTLQRVELATAPNDDYDSEVVAFEMNGGAVVGQGDPPEKGAPILAAAQQPDASS